MKVAVGIPMSNTVTENYGTRTDIFRPEPRSFGIARMIVWKYAARAVAAIVGAPRQMLSPLESDHSRAEVRTSAKFTSKTDSHPGGAPANSETISFRTAVAKNFPAAKSGVRGPGGETQ
jgi:hypothetical protein